MFSLLAPHIIPFATQIHVPTTQLPPFAPHNTLPAPRAALHIAITRHRTQHHRFFTVFRPTVRFTPDNGATDILIPTGKLHLPSTPNIYLAAYIFADHELAENLFGLAPLVNKGAQPTFPEALPTLQHSCYNVNIDDSLADCFTNNRFND